MANLPNQPVRPVYLDYQATTPTDPRVLQAMLPYFSEAFGNPHSAQHRYGSEAEAAVERARAEVAGLIGAEPNEIVFTSGATESNNLALIGALRFRRAQPAAPRDHLVTVATEHKCVLEAARAAEAEGARLTILPVEPDGRLDPERLAAALDERTALVSVMAANNETGVLQPLAEIAAIAHRHGAWLHTDAAQAAGKVPLDVAADGIDLLSLSGHKIYGPKGIGALYVRRRPRVRLVPLIHGGGQERGLRSGTLPTPLCVGLGAAAALAGAEMAEEAARLGRLRDRLLAGLRAAIPDLQVNGSLAHRLPGNLNLAIPGVDADALLAGLPELALSTGSACSSAAVEPSYVLRAIGLDEAAARGSLRIGLGRFSTEAEVDFAVERLAAAVRAARRPAA
ncbi:MAG: cysteine desulfurase family protein [Dongiaceae bacterium]